MKTKLLLVVVVALGALAMIGCDGKPEDNAAVLCGKEFSGDGDASRADACLKGVGWGKDNIYGSFQMSSNPPNVHDYRAKYNETRSWCGMYLNEPYKDVSKQMACLDGLDIYTALLADTANYQTRDYNDVVLDEAYYAKNDYYSVYNDFGDDDEWLFFLMHRNLYPEYYPGYRRDQYYIVLNPWGYYPYSPTGYYYNGFLYSQFRSPYRANYSGYTGRYAGSGYFGPSAAPRPYAAGTVWYRPATSSTGYGYVPASRYRPGTYGSGKWGTSGSVTSSSAFKSSPFASASRGTYGTAASGGGYGSSSSNYGGFGGSSSGSSSGG